MTPASRPPGPRSPTLEDVARIAGVSRATVSRVVNTTRNVDPAISEAVKEAIKTTGYVPNNAARTLVTRRTGTIALVLSGSGGDDPHEVASARIFADPFFGRVASGVVSHLRPLGMHPVLMLADSAESHAQVADHLRQGTADGAVLISTQSGDPLPAMLVAAGLPAVLFARPLHPLGISYVDLAHQEGAALAARHLVARGCSRIATISGPLDVPASQDRLEGFLGALGRPVPQVEGNFTFVSGERAMERLLAEHPDVDGVFAANDLMAQGALNVLRDHGRRVPHDVAVIGFDDSSAATASRPALTTIRQPVEEMAAELTRILLDGLDQREHRVTSVIFDPVLIIRQSA